MNYTSKETAIRKLITSFTPVRKEEVVDTTEALGRVLSEDVYSLCSIPVVRASSMDGIAVRGSDFISGMPDTSLFRPGIDYVRADTGDDFPDAFDTVIAIEDVDIHPDGGITLSCEKVVPSMNVRPSGSMVREGELLVKKGKRLTAYDEAKILSGGVWKIKVVRKPRVVFIPTGSELTEIGGSLARGQNYDTNSALVSALLSEWGCKPILHPIVKDSRNEIRGALEESLCKADVVLLSAGTSKGEEDYTFRVLDDMGKLLFHSVKAAPGRPMAAAVVDGKPVINLSGPSVACLHGMLWCVRPVIEYVLGVDKIPRHTVRAALTRDLTFKFPISLMMSFHLTQDEKGKWYATPHPFKEKRPEEMVGMGVDAVYMSRVGEKMHKKGDILTFEVL